MAKQYSDKKTVKALIDLCVEAGIREAVISPGSRNAPLIFSFSACKDIQSVTIVDERSAAFFALGMAQQLHRPVALICTSGTAVLNYAPAIAEAYYQQIPLVVITADRPPEWIDQADGQTIRQNNIYANYIKYSCTLPLELNTDEDTWNLNRVVREALFTCVNFGDGPVHINVPLQEPLYGKQIFKAKKAKVTQRICPKVQITEEQVQSLATRVFDFESIMILMGMHQPDPELNRLLNLLVEKYNVVVLTETTSNLTNPSFIGCIDRVLESIAYDNMSIFVPDVLITTDGQVTSKKIKNLLRENPPKEHWHVSISPSHPDTYRSLTASVDMELVPFLEAILPYLNAKRKRYLESWLTQDKFASQRHDYFLSRLEWSDLKFFSVLKKFIPEGTMVQLANSTPVRYVQLFDGYNENLTFFANRGTSGIDGCTSTAAGASYASRLPTLFISGDLSFFYDSNALWNNYLRPDFKIIMINNGGGGIFRHVCGPMSNEEMEEYFEVKQDISCELLVKCYGLEYYCCENEADLLRYLPVFFAKNEKPSVLEVKTPRLDNARLLKEYFNHLK